MFAEALARAKRSQELSHIANSLLPGLLRKCIAKRNIEFWLTEQSRANEELRLAGSATTTDHIEELEHHVASWLNSCLSQRNSTLSTLSASSVSTFASASTDRDIRSSFASSATNYSDFRSVGTEACETRSQNKLHHHRPLDRPPSEPFPAGSGERHLQKPLPPTPSKVQYRCPCGVSCSRRSDFHKHMKNQHMYFGGFQCVLCGQLKPSAYCIEQHHEEYHLGHPRKKAWEERRETKDGFAWHCNEHGQSFDSFLAFFDHVSADSEVAFIKAFLLHPAVSDQLNQCFGVHLTAQGIQQAVQQLSWSAEAARAIIRRHRDDRNFVDLSTSVKQILQAAMLSGPLDLGQATTGQSQSPWSLQVNLGDTPPEVGKRSPPGQTSVPSEERTQAREAASEDAFKMYADHSAMDTGTVWDPTSSSEPHELLLLDMQLNEGTFGSWLDDSGPFDGFSANAELHIDEETIPKGSDALTACLGQWG